MVAILDRRLISMRYGTRIIRAMPRLLRTTDRQRALMFLDSVLGAPDT